VSICGVCSLPGTVPSEQLPIALIIVPIVLAIGLGAMMITLMSGEGFETFLVLFLVAGGWLFFNYFFR